MKKKIRALLISQFFWPENFPINKIIRSINKIEFLIITAKPNYPYGNTFKSYRKSGSIIEKFFNHLICHIPVVPRKTATSLFLFLNYFSFIFSSIFYGTRFLKKKKIDVVFVYNTSPITQILVGFYFKIFFKTKLVTWVQDIWPESISATNHVKENFIFNIFRKICHRIYILNDILILQSENFIKYFKKYKINVKKIYIPNSSNIVLTKFNKKHNLKRKFTYNFVYAGNIGMAQEFKNFEFFLKKLYLKNKKIKFHLIGSGSYKKILVKKIREKNITNVEIYPYINNKNLYHYLKQADVCFLSLKNNYIFNLTIPSKLQNYLYCKKPILAWADGITKKIILDSKCGLAVKPGNINDLILAVLKMCNKKKLKNFGKNSKNLYIKNFQINLIKNKITQLLINTTK